MTIYLFWKLYHCLTFKNGWSSSYNKQKGSWILLMLLLKLSFFANTFCCWWRFRRQWTNLKSFWCSPTLLAITEQSYEDFKNEDPNPHRTFLDTSQNVYKVSFLTPVLTFTFFSTPLNWHRVEFIAFYNLISNIHDS